MLLLLLSFCGGVEGKKICWKKIAFSWNRFGSHSVEHIICTSYIKNWVTPPWFFIFKNQLTMYTTFVISISKKREEKDFSKPFWHLQCTTWWINHVQIKVNCRFAVKLNWGFFPLVSLERKNIPKQLFLSKINFSVENKIFNNNSLVHDDSAVDYPHQSNIISCLLQSYDFWSMNLWLEMKWRISLSQSCTHWPVIFGKDNTTLDVGGKWIRRELAEPSQKVLSLLRTSLYTLRLFKRKKAPQKIFVF